MGSRGCRDKNALTLLAVNSRDKTLGAKPCHQTGASFPAWKRTAPNCRGSEKTKARRAWKRTRWSCFAGLKSGFSTCKRPVMPRCSPSQRWPENRNSINLPRASERSSRDPASDFTKAGLPNRKLRVLSCKATRSMRWRNPRFHWRRNHSTSASSGMRAMALNHVAGFRRMGRIVQHDPLDVVWTICDSAWAPRKTKIAMKTRTRC